jgi:hypothetical protein
MIQTNIDLSHIKLVLSKTTMLDIFKAFRLYRNRVVMSKRQLHDLSPMTPLKPETIARKKGIHTVSRFGGGTAKASSVRFKRAGRVSLTPDTPLVDSGNMVAPNALDPVASDGYLEIRQGKTRAAIAGYHNQGGSHLPQRVHMSFNQEFADMMMRDIVDPALDKAIQAAVSPKTYGSQ